MPKASNNERRHNRVLVILGPTATGKSDLAVSLAKMVERERIAGYSGAEIVSADSRQAYKGLNIGTGKVTRAEMRGVPHHLLDVADPHRRFTAERFQRLASKAVKDIGARGKLPIICGGTGFYIDSLVNGTRFPPVKADHKLRARLRHMSAARLLVMLEKLDPERARTISANDSERKNCRRIIRAIEVATHAGTKKGNQTAIRNISPRESFSPVFIGLQLPREELRSRIRARLLKRLKKGMLVEAIRLHQPIGKRDKKGKMRGGLSWKRLEELGLEYRYMALHLQGKMTKRQMTEKLNTEIWHYAKRQMTWFKRDDRINWINPNDIEAATGIVKKIATED